MDPLIEVWIGPEPIDPAREYQALERDTPAIGAICTFVGLVRDSGDEAQVEGLTLEHYPGMTERSIESIGREAARRWNLRHIRVAHRVGYMTAGERIVFVGVNGIHRHDAFEACEFMMDFLKTEAPFWKKEWSPEGGRWVEQKETDRERTERWRRD